MTTGCVFVRALRFGPHSSFDMRSRIPKSSLYRGLSYLQIEPCWNDLVRFILFCVAIPRIEALVDTYLEYTVSSDIMAERPPERFQLYISCAYPTLLFGNNDVQYGATSVVRSIDESITVKSARRHVVLYSDADAEEGKVRQARADQAFRYRQETTEEEQAIFRI